MLEVKRAEKSERSEKVSARKASEKKQVAARLPKSGLPLAEMAVGQNPVPLVNIK